MRGRGHPSNDMTIVASDASTSAEGPKNMGGVVGSPMTLGKVV